MSIPEPSSPRKPQETLDDQFPPGSGQVVNLGFGCIIIVGGLLVFSLTAAWWPRNLGKQFLFDFTDVWICGTFMLLSIWLGLGNDSLGLRFSLASMPCLLVGMFSGPSVFLGFPVAECLLLTTTAPFFVMRLRGFEFRPLEDPGAADCDPERRLQFSLKQMLIVTAIVSVIVFLLSLQGRVREKDISLEIVVDFFAMGSLFATANLAIACATLFPGARWMVAARIGLLLSAVVALLGLAVAVLERRSFVIFIQLSFLVGVPALVVALVLLGFRRIGYRIVRRGQ